MLESVSSRESVTRPERADVDVKWKQFSYVKPLRVSIEWFAQIRLILNGYLLTTTNSNFKSTLKSFLAQEEDLDLECLTDFMRQAIDLVTCLRWIEKPSTQAYTSTINKGKKRIGSTSKSYSRVRGPHPPTRLGALSVSAEWIMRQQRIGFTSIRRPP